MLLQGSRGWHLNTIFKQVTRNLALSIYFDSNRCKETFGHAWNIILISVLETYYLNGFLNFHKFGYRKITRHNYSTQILDVN